MPIKNIKDFNVVNNLNINSDSLLSVSNNELKRLNGSNASLFISNLSGVNITGANLTLSNQAVTGSDTTYLTWYGSTQTANPFEIFIDNIQNKRLLVPTGSVGTLDLKINGVHPNPRATSYVQHYHIRRASPSITIMNSGLISSGTSVNNAFDATFGIGGILISGNDTAGTISIFAKPNDGTRYTRVKTVGEISFLIQQ